MTWAAPAVVLAKRTHCPRGHEYTPENIYRKDDGLRRCKECKRAWNREYMRRRRNRDRCSA